MPERSLNVQESRVVGTQDVAGRGARVGARRGNEHRIDGIPRRRPECRWETEKSRHDHDEFSDVLQLSQLR